MDTDRQASGTSSDSDGVLVVSSHREGSRAVIELSGDLDLDGSTLLISELRRVMTPAVEQLEIDAGDLTFMDSAGIHAVLVAREEAETHGIAFRMTAVSGPVRRVVEFAGLQELLPPVTVHDNHRP